MRLHRLASFLIGQLYLHHVPDLVHHATDGGRVVVLDRLLEPPEPERADGLALLLCEANLASHPFNLDPSHRSHLRCQALPRARREE